MANTQLMAFAIGTATGESRRKWSFYGPISSALYWKRDFGTGSPGISERVRNTVPFSSRLLLLLAVTALEIAHIGPTEGNAGYSFGRHFYPLVHSAIALESHQLSRSAHDRSPHTTLSIDSQTIRHSFGQACK
jgi:hypothetical protein